MFRVPRVDVDAAVVVLSLWCCPYRLLLTIMLIVSPPLTFNCQGQYEHFRNRESVFKEYHPYYEHEGKNVSAVAGQSILIPCGVRNLGDRYVSWLRGSDLQVLSSGWDKFTGDSRIRIIPADRSHSWTLAIRNVTTSDTGVYYCQVNTEPKLSLTNYLTVTDSTALIPGNHERGVQAGSSLTLKCSIVKTVLPHENPPSIQWLQNGQPVDSKDHVVVTTKWSNEETSLESRLEISSVELSDSGVYTCQSGDTSQPSKVNAEANVTVIVISGEQRAAILEENTATTRYAPNTDWKWIWSCSWIIYYQLIIGRALVFN